MNQSPRMKLLVVELEGIYRYLYHLIPVSDHIDVVDILTDLDAGAVEDKIETLHPDVLLLGVRKLSNAAVEALTHIRESYPKLGIVLFLFSCSNAEMEILRKLAFRKDGGMAVFLRQSLGQIEQLTGIIHAAGYGQLILDPPLANYMLSPKSESPFLEQLTTRELEILGLLSRGYTNSAIAESLYIDVKTVEHHLNSIYSKLKSETDVDRRHLRVAATRIYLSEMGSLIS